MPAAQKNAKRRPPRRQRTEKKLSRLKAPEGMTVEEWQRALRRQFGGDQQFAWENVGEEPVFSLFRVSNAQSGGRYLVTVRGEESGVSTCNCGDFTTNGLGTCKHVEFVLARLRQKRGGKQALAEGHQPAYSEVFQRYGTEREVCFRPGSECPVELARLAGRYFDEEGKLREEAFHQFETFLAKSARVDHELRVSDDVIAHIAQVRDAQRRAEILHAAFPRGAKSAALNKLVNAKLYDYQREGALFAARAGRSLIGDEMGLGKTIQAIAATEIMARHFGVGRVLIVCPTSLKHQWEREIERFAPRPTTVIGGLRAERERRYADDAFYKIVNYDTIHRDLELIQRWSPDLVILDEAQRIKNWETRTARCVKRIESPYCIVLTGTPLENRLEELVSIVQFVDRNRLGPTFRFLREHQVYEEETGRVIGYQQLDRISETLRPILLRRRKNEVLSQLPERLEQNQFVEMTPQQWTHHDENQEIVAKIVHKWRRYHFLSEQDKTRLMIALQYMRMSCNSTYLIDHETDYGRKADELASLLADVLEEDDTKAVIFSQWTATHELIQRRLDRLRCGHVFFHGGVDGNKRKGLVDQFREDPNCRLFLSTDAGGVGLNLQHASVIVNMDLPWNPAVLEQRIGRVHRLGQKRAVRVVNFIAQGTIEEGMLGVIKFKKSLFAGVLDDGQKEVFLGSSRLKKFMETVEQTTESIAAGNGSRADAAGETADDQPSAQPEASSEIMRAAAAAESPAANPLAALLQSGLSVLAELSQATGPAQQRDPRAAGDSGVRVVRDAQSNRSYLQLALPEPQVLQEALTSLGKLVEQLARRT